MKIDNIANLIIWLAEHLSQTIWSFLVTFYLVWNVLETIYILYKNRFQEQKG